MAQNWTTSAPPDHDHARANLPRAGAMLLCGAVIAARAVWPELRFDSVSLWLLLATIVILLIPDLGGLVDRVKKLKKGDFEVEFAAKIQHMREETEELECEGAGSESSEQALYDELTAEMRRLLEISGGNARAALINMAVAIEAEIHRLAKQSGLQSAYQLRSPTRLVRELVQQEIISTKAADLFAEFWSVRNQAVHSPAFRTSDASLFQLVDLGLRLLRILRSFDGSSSSSGSGGID